MKDLTRYLNRRYGRLVVVDVTPRNHESGRRLVGCVCDCGTTNVWALWKNVRGSKTRPGNTRSCGCLRVGARRRAKPRVQDKRPRVPVWDERLATRLRWLRAQRTKPHPSQWVTPYGRSA